MKKSLSVFLVLMVISSIAYAEISLYSMSIDDLIALNTQIVQELLDRGAMKSATVPAGEYTIGKDIPAGEYSISTDQLLVSIIYGDYNLYMATPENGIGKVILKDGEKFQCSSTIVLTKYAGLSFE